MKSKFRTSCSVLLSVASIAAFSAASPAYAQFESFVYSSGAFTIIAPPGNGYPAGLGVNSINNLGQIVGTDSFGKSFLYSGGVYTDIVPPGSSSSSTRGINDSGQIVGSFSSSSGGGSFLYSGGSF